MSLVNEKFVSADGYLGGTKIRVSVSMFDKCVYICLYDMLSYLKRVSDMRTRWPQELCDNIKKINAQAGGGKQVYYASVPDIKRLLHQYKNESATMFSRCQSALEWVEGVEAEVLSNPIKYEHVKKEGDKIIQDTWSIFKNNEYSIRTTTIDDTPFFVGIDIASALGYTYPKDAIRDNVDPEDKKVVQLSDIQQGENYSPHSLSSKITIINESGLYSLILRSRNSAAKGFKRWVTSEVLPQIRKTGGYIPVKPEDSDVEILAKAHLILERTIADMRDKIQIDKPKVEYYDNMVENRDWFNTSTIASELKMTAIKLNKALIEMGVCQRGKYQQVEAVGRYAHLQSEVPYRWSETPHKQSYSIKKWNKSGREFILNLMTKM